MGLVPMGTRREDSNNSHSASLYSSKSFIDLRTTGTATSSSFSSKNHEKMLCKAEMRSMQMTTKFHATLKQEKAGL